MKRAKNTNAPQQRTELDAIVTQLRTILHRQTTDVVLAGQLLIESRELFANKHGDWQPWLAENFDLSLRTAQNYVVAAEYVARQNQIGNHVADFSNLAPTVLYGLAAGHYNAEEEAALLAATSKGRVDQTRASAICMALAPPLLLPPPPPPPHVDDDDNGNRGSKGGSADKDAEFNAIIDGPPPAVSPPTPISPPNVALREFDQAIGVLKRLMTKSSTQFVSSIHSRESLENVACFIRGVADRAREATTKTSKHPTAPRICFTATTTTASQEQTQTGGLTCGSIAKIDKC